MGFGGINKASVIQNQDVPQCVVKSSSFSNIAFNQAFHVSILIKEEEDVG